MSKKITLAEWKARAEEAERKLAAVQESIENQLKNSLQNIVAAKTAHDATFLVREHVQETLRNMR